MSNDLIRAIRSALREKRFIPQAVMFLLTAFGMFTAILSMQTSEQKRKESPTYVEQVELLNGVQESLKNVSSFVELQLKKLQESEDVINGLRAEQEKLKPLVETDRKTIEAILDFQMEKARSDVWKERAIGFGSGILASIIASFMYGLTRRLSRKATPPIA